MRRTRSIVSMSFSIIAAICATDTSAVRCAADDNAAARPVNFIRDIASIFAARCLKCHGPDEQEARLRLDARKVVFGGGIGGPAVVPKSLEKSLVWQRINGLNGLERMPLEGEPLPAAEIDRIRQWIESGATWPDGYGVDAESVRRHWAYVKPVRPDVPSVHDVARVRNPIDSFILERLEAKGLRFSSDANKEQLIRRVTLDLIGVPPTIDEIDAFVADDDPNAYELLLDRLLASPRYGERWATPWLDAARYADSNGYQRDDRRDLWAFRDWVIRALNDDMPFDQFTLEQIAGDLLPNRTIDQLIATGFHRSTMANVEAGTDPEEQRVLTVIDRVNTTGTVWLGTTIECAQCHHHKYDPFSQTDYYRLFAYFNNTEKEIQTLGEGSKREFIGPKFELSSSEADRALHAELGRQIEQLTGEMSKLANSLAPGRAEWEKKQLAKLTDDSPEIPAEIREILSTTESARTDEQKKDLKEYYLSQSEEYRKLRRKVKGMQRQFDQTSIPTTLVMQELPHGRPTRVLNRGDFLKPGQEVKPGTPAVLAGNASVGSSNRLTLAEWLVDPNNPLTSRVIVNRHWTEFFGHGLVSTTEDFGTQGERPTHPQLLDWLATEFIRQGWSVKALHRLVVTSTAYRQSSRVTPELLSVDPANKSYTRAPRLRLRAEQVRDNGLVIAGLLTDKMYGPPVFPVQPDGIWNHSGVTNNEWATSRGEDLYRRGVYIYWRRTVPYPSLVSFDAPSREACKVQRSYSTTPLQALTLMNDPVFFEASSRLAARMVTEAGESATVADRLAYGFRLATSRRPKTSEVEILTDRQSSERRRFEHSFDALAELLKNSPPPAGVDPAEFAAWVCVANVLLNLDETITKN